MKVLNFEKPKKLRSTKDHNDIYVSDSDVAGTYVPNMSEEDNQKWKAKHIKGKNERVEIRKAIGGVQMVLVIYKQSAWVDYSDYDYKNPGSWHDRHKDVQISMNGKLHLSMADVVTMQLAINEAKLILNS